jgi:IS30 family transposase
MSPEILISERPAEAAGRAVPGHWEGDLIVGLNSSAIGTLVERTTRFTLLLHLPPMDGHDSRARIKNGPALAGHGAEAVRDAIADAIGTLPVQLRRSLTGDQGAEMAQHGQLRIDTGVEIYFCDPHSPWQRGSNENTNGLLRQYFPKGTDLARHTPGDLDAVALALNTRPHKTLRWKTPAEALDELLHCLQYLRKGDVIQLHLGKAGWVRYKVTSVRRVRWNDRRWMARTPTERLTLQTCTTYRKTADRLIVIAVPVA